MRSLGWRGPALLAAALASGCGSGALPTPEPRPILVYTGERIQPDEARMSEVEVWLVPELERIDLDPDFLIRLEEGREATYPWDTLRLIADTAEVHLQSAAPDAQSPYMIYGYLKLMEEQGELPEILPEVVGLSGYEVERAIISRMADVWLLGRSSYDTHPFGPLDELVFSKENGFLEDFIFATQGDVFPEDAVAYRQANPGREAEYSAWFRATFQANGPQYIVPPGEEPSSPDVAADGDPAQASP